MIRPFLALPLFCAVLLAAHAAHAADAQSLPASAADPGNPANFAVVVYNANDPLAEPLAKFTPVNAASRRNGSSR